MLYFLHFAMHMLYSFKRGIVFLFLSAVCGPMIYCCARSDSSAFQCHDCPPTLYLFISLFGLVLYLKLLFFPLDAFTVIKFQF